MKSRIRKLINNPYKIVTYLAARGVLNWVPDKYYLKLMYRGRVGKKLNLEEPTTYNEKLQWLKLYNRNPIYTNMVDKYEVRNYISETIGEEYLIPLVGVYDKFDDINFDKLPQQFVLKTTHDSGGVVICKDKNNFDIKEAEKKLNKSLKKNYYYHGREWPYKNVKPRIICEKYMEDENEEDLIDYKFMCFNGEPKLIQFHRNRRTNYTLDFYDINWNKTDIVQGVNKSNKVTNKPDCIDKMVELVKKLADDTYFVRIDLYYINKKIYFGEITYYPTSGFTPFENIEDDIRLGSWIKLPI